MDKTKQPLSIFMDFSKAFDTVDHRILLEKLKYYGIINKSLNVFRSYLENRFQYTEYQNGKSENLSINCGVPQGSILGPLLFIIYINDIANVTHMFKPLLYADDTTLIASLNHVSSDNIDRLNNELQAVNNWLKVNRLSLNIAKTKAMLFHTPQKKVIYPDLFINETRIKFVKNFNFLGFVIDEHLSWNCHIDAVSKKVSKIVGIMSKIKNEVNSDALLNIYNALVLPHLNYGLMAWGWKSDRLFTLQKRAVRVIAKSHHRAHTTNIFQKLNILKMKELCALQEYKFCYKFHHALLPHYYISQINSKLETKKHIYDTRNDTIFRLPAVRHNFATHCISYTYPYILNNMPTNIKEKLKTHSIDGYKFYIKRKFIETYSGECVIPNCYSCQFTKFYESQYIHVQVSS